MLVLYYPPFRADDDIELADQTVIALRAYVEDLAEFPQDALRNGWREVRRAHKVERWPTIQVIRDACIAAQNQPEKRKAPSPQESRLEQYRRTGFWASHWGEKPDSDDERNRRHREWLASRSPSEIAHYEETKRRLESGESALSMFTEVAGANEMPLLACEKSGRNSERVRADSIRRAEDGS